MRWSALAFAMLCLGGSAAADVDGIWKSAPRANGGFIIVEIAPCADAPQQRCGRIIQSSAGRADLIGEIIIFGMTRAGADDWTHGHIRRPGGGGTYRSNLHVAGDVLTVQGCAVGGLICQSQDWTRAR
ncbi:MAG: DUF2147 domain-containing protein [Pseudomonadota bacterium]